MSHLPIRIPLAVTFALLLQGQATELSGDSTLSISLTNKQAVVRLPIIPAIDEFKIFTAPRLTVPFAPAQTGKIDGYRFTDSVLPGNTFYQVRLTPKSSNDVLVANVLNRIAYGPTPDELERVRAIGADAYIAEQLAPENISEDLDIDKVITTADWQYVSVTGIATTSDLYIYLASAGDAYIDDIQFVKGTQAGVGPNLIKNGDFETGVLSPWTLSANLTNSVLDAVEKHGGNGGLHIVSTAAGESKASSIWQTMTGVTANSAYTLSFWYKPGTNVITGLTVRLSGSGVVATPDPLGTKLADGKAVIDDLRAWHVLHAVRSKRQLLEVLLQFFDNHFVTQYSKTRDYFDGTYDSPQLQQVATDTEYRELQKWRQALLNPNCTFYDLLKISAESPAMIIYLDTVNGKGNGNNIANENYARELLELFTFGVDNGYDQNDITVSSRAWTGWSVDILDPAQASNPFAPRSTLKINTVGTNLNATSNIFGIWSLSYKQANHNTTVKTIFPNKTVPDRFGPPYAGRNYQLVLPSRTGTNGIQDGYELIAHLANQPFTQEFISVKLCRLFVHEDFATGYDFTDPALSPEGQLVRRCMEAWEIFGGKLRPVLATIFSSDLFRGQGGSVQKVKTPLEFTVSTIRALRSQNADGSATSDTDGYGLKIPMGRMGSMNIFDRAEPDGWPEAGTAWISAGTLAERLRFVQTTCMALTESGRADGIANGNRNIADPVALLKKKLASASWTDAGALADYFVGILFPAEGKANLDQYRTAAMSFLNTGDDGVTSSPLVSLSSTSTTYDTRIRGMVGMLMTTQRFQEQ